MPQAKKTPLLLYLLILVYFCGCKSYQPISFLIDQSTTKRFLKKESKLAPGDILRFEIFWARGFGNGRVPPMAYSTRIPIRKIEIGRSSLKDYEINFLIMALASGAKKEIDIKFQDSLDVDLVQVWNTIVNHSIMVNDTIYNTLKVQIHWDSLPKKNKFRPYMYLNKRRDLIILPRKVVSQYEYFNKDANGKLGGKYYHTDSSRNQVPSSELRYSVEKNGLNPHHFSGTSNEALWSVQDWLSSGLGCFEVDSLGSISTVKWLKLYGIKGKIKILENSSGASTVDSLLKVNNYGSIPKKITKEELRFILMKNVSKIKFRGIDHANKIVRKRN